METMVISYSLTGNNADLAASLAETLGAEHVRITEPKRRTMSTIVLDVLFKRTPKIVMPAAKAEEYDWVLFVGPVWMGQVASPFRACFKQLYPKIAKYAFISINGGADGPKSQACR
jgi:flavodoxin